MEVLSLGSVSTLRLDQRWMKSLDVRFDGSPVGLDTAQPVPGLASPVSSSFRVGVSTLVTGHIIAAKIAAKFGVHNDFGSLRFFVLFLFLIIN
jgi:hypothetical protein